MVSVLNDINLFVPKFDIDACLDAVRACLEKGWTGIGDQTDVFEAAFGLKFGFDRALFVNSASAGLHLAVNILKDARHWRTGDEIITTPVTFVATNHAILYEGLVPVFADVDQYLCLDPTSVESLITPRTRAVMFVGLGGNTGQLAAIMELCRRHNLALIIDAAHMTGSLLDGRNPVVDADAAIYSFQAVKNLPTGDAGMVCFKQPEHDIVARKKAWLGIDRDTFSRANDPGGYSWDYEVDHVGFKYHGNSLMAAIALSQLAHVDDDNAHRRQIAAAYTAGLAGCPDLQIVPTAPGCTSSRHLFQVLVPDRPAVMSSLKRQRIFTGVHYKNNREFSVYRDARGDCPYAASVSRSVLSLPLHLRLSADDVARVCSAVIAAVRPAVAANPLDTRPTPARRQSRAGIRLS